MQLYQSASIWLSKAGIELAEKQYNAKYMGGWCIKDKHGNWSELPVDVFYQPNPNRELGHSHYFGLFGRGNEIMITDAQSAFSKVPLLGILEDGLVYVSRFRHDAVATPLGKFIDGGRDYIHSNFAGNFIKVSVYDHEFVFEE